MEELRAKAKELLEGGTVRTVIGYEAGPRGTRRPLLAREPRDGSRFVWDGACTGNLGCYLTRPEVRRRGPAAVTASPDTLRSLLQLLAERQLVEGEVLALVRTSQGGLEILATGEAVEAHLALLPRTRDPKDAALLERLGAMSREERWAFWRAELGRCIKCYACRASCPMCYCGQCTMDCNRPQWVPQASHALGNLEYHMVRAMHLAGRCVACGECGRACPVDIPVHLLTFHAQDSVERQFGQQAGTSAKLDYALSTFRPDDQESFIR
jgi:ferredoxin